MASDEKRMCGQKFRLYPTDEEAEQLAQAAGACRALWNAALEQRRTAWRSHGVSLNSFGQNDDLTALLHDEQFAWLRDCVARTTLEQSLRDLDRAFANFFAGRGAYPKFKRRGVHDSFRQRDRAFGFRKLNRRWAEVRVPKIGWIRLRLHQPIRGQLQSATFSRDALGWHVSFAVVLTGPAPAKPSPSPVGLDRGIAATVATSTGAFHHMPKAGAGESRRRLVLERRLARQVPGSNRRARTRGQLARLRSREAARRQGFVHELSTSVARSHDVVVIERLDVQRMTKSAAGTIEQPGTNVAAKRGLNRSILEHGWGELRRQLHYKLEWRGSTLIEVDPRHTSQTCSACGHVARENRKSQAVFSCNACGHIEHADTNAARNILARGIGQEPGGALPLAARGGFGASRPLNREPAPVAAQPSTVSTGKLAATAAEDNHHLTPLGSA